ncbi:hypothetical protein CHCC14527_0755 [Bacillus paralicheniformis]|nr:hypothetical protein CHCC15332_1631 [Bacillus paralicheniformis]TWN39909.1 hypothetical protein CHCC14527_0755 [Bacillus paralicheniformis]
MPKHTILAPASTGRFLFKKVYSGKQESLNSNQALCFLFHSYDIKTVVTHFSANREGGNPF